MNTSNSIAVSAFFSMAATVQVANALSRDEFCRNLTRLESHMDVGLAAVWPDGQGEYESSYDCACIDPGEGADGFAIDCDERGPEGEYFSSEQMVFEPRGGEYFLVRTSWGEKDPSTDRLDIPQEKFFLDGNVVGCKANGCTSCEVCDDGRSVAVDCGAHEGWNYTYACADGYEGSFSNSFDFGVITGKDGAGKLAPPTPTAGPVDKDTFCGIMAELEAHMDDGFEKLMKMTFTSSFECTCGETSEDNDIFAVEGTVDNGFAVNCYMMGTTGAEYFVSSEHLTFELNQGAYELRQASWSWKDSSVTWDFQETFYFEEGSVASCEAAGCASCGLCDDGESIELDCSALEGFEYIKECNEGYTGAFANTFDFGVILQSANQLSETASTSVTLPGKKEPITQATGSGASATVAAGESSSNATAPTNATSTTDHANNETNTAAANDTDNSSQTATAATPAGTEPTEVAAATAGAPSATTNATTTDNSSQSATAATPAGHQQPNVTEVAATIGSYAATTNATVAVATNATVGSDADNDSQVATAATPAPAGYQQPNRTEPTEVAAATTGANATLAVGHTNNTTNATVVNDTTSDPQATTAATPKTTTASTAPAAGAPSAATVAAKTPDEMEDEGQVEGRGDVLANRAVSLRGIFWTASSAACILSGLLSI